MELTYIADLWSYLIELVYVAILWSYFKELLYGGTS